MAIGPVSSSYRAPAPTTFAPQTGGLAPWLRQPSAPLQASGRVGQFLRTGIMPSVQTAAPSSALSSPALPSFAQNDQPWYGAALDQSMSNAASNVAAQQTAAQALEAQQIQAEIIRNMEETNTFGNRIREHAGDD